MKSFLTNLLFLPLVAGYNNFPVIRNLQDEGCDFGPTALSDAFGKDIQHTCLDVDGVQRCYYSYVPESCAEINVAPMVVDMHGLNGCPLDHAGYSGWMEIAEKECIVMVWPSGNNDPAMMFGTCFQIPGFLRTDDTSMMALPCCCFESETDISMDAVGDTAFIKMTIDMVIETMTSAPTVVDKHRVYMAGHSNGCLMSHGMAALHSDTVAAVCCHAGGIITPLAADYNPTPIWTVHGSLDQEMKIEGNVIATVPGFGDFGFLSKDSQLEYLAEHNECTDIDEEDFISEGDGNETIIGSITRHTNCAMGADLELVTMFDQGHWPFDFEDKPEMKAYAESTGYGVSTTIDTTAMAWDFCSSHTLNGAGPMVVEMKEEEEPASSGGGGGREGPTGCYDVGVHRCMCSAETCTAEKCGALGFAWTSGCNSLGPDDCVCPDGSTEGSAMTTEEESSSGGGAREGPQGCYDISVHVCMCDDNTCSAEKCGALNMMWTSGCNSLTASCECPEGVDSGVAATADAAPETEPPSDDGGCYDIDVGSCSCDSDRCTRELCESEELDLIWTADCPVHCKNCGMETATNGDHSHSDDEEGHSHSDDEESSANGLSVFVGMMFAVVVAIFA